MGSIIIRKLSKEDQAKLADFLSQLTPEVYLLWNRLGYSLNEFEPNAASAKLCNMPGDQEEGFIALADDGKISGYSYLRYFPDKKPKKHNASLGIVVSPDQHGQGVGKKLMLFMHDWAKKHGIQKIWLATYAKNTKALNLYKKLGYQTEGIFMYDEKLNDGWDHVVSLAYFIGDEFRAAREERKALAEQLEKEISI